MCNSAFIIRSEFYHLNGFSMCITKVNVSLLQFLATTGYTGVFEILSPEHQHVEDLSYLSG